MRERREHSMRPEEEGEGQTPRWAEWGAPQRDSSWGLGEGAGCGTEVGVSWRGWPSGRGLHMGGLILVSRAPMPQSLLKSFKLANPKIAILSSLNTYTYFTTINSGGFPSTNCTRNIPENQKEQSATKNIAYAKLWEPANNLTSQRFIWKKYGKWSNYEYGTLDFYENGNLDLEWVLDHEINFFKILWTRTLKLTVVKSFALR